MKFESFEFDGLGEYPFAKYYIFILFFFLPFQNDCFPTHFLTRPYRQKILNISFQLWQISLTIYYSGES